MRFLANENIEQQVIEALRAAGHDVACVSDTVPGASDARVGELANSECRIILTNDKDFGELAFREDRAAEGIILLRLRSEVGVSRARRVTEIRPAAASKIPGHFAVISDERIRLRPLRRSPAAE